MLAYRKREIIKKELRRWTAKEMSAGPLKFERDKEKVSSRVKRGVQIGSKGDFSGAKIKNVAGRDIVQGEELISTNAGAVPGVDIGEGKYKDAEIENIAGRDIQQARSFEDSDETNSNGAKK